MPRLKIIFIERSSKPFIKEGERYYLDRIKNYIPINWIPIKGLKIGKENTFNYVLDKEYEKILSKIKGRDYIILMDSRGKKFSSEEFARFFEDLLNRCASDITFIIGGPLGISKRLSDISHIRISLSDLTLNHQIARLLLLEQIYRAFTIIRGESYHK